MDWGRGSVSVKCTKKMAFLFKLTESRKYPDNSAKTTGAWLQKGVPFMQSWPMKHQLGHLGIPKFYIPVLASSQEKTRIWNRCDFGYTPFETNKRNITIKSILLLSTMYFSTVHIIQYRSGPLVYTRAFHSYSDPRFCSAYSPRMKHLCCVHQCSSACASSSFQ